VTSEGKRRAFLGVDCGTGSTKALLIDADSTEEIAIGRADHEIIQAADGTSRQRPDWWVEAAVTAIREAVAAAPGVEVAGIGVSGQQHGFVSLDAGDRPLEPSPLWNDTTSAAECLMLTESLGSREAVLRLTGNAFLPGYTAPALLGQRLKRPQLYAKAARFCLPHDWLNLWLTGTFATEPGDASGTAYFDVRSRTYSRAVLDAIDTHRDWDAALPPVGPSLSVLGTLRPDLAAQLGLRAGTPVSGGGGDNMCAAIGIGATEEGHVVVSLGTSATAFSHHGSAAVDPDGEAAAFCSSDDGWLPLGCTFNATGATDWIRNLFGWSRDRFESAVTETEAGAGGITVLPYFVGERTPAVPSGSGTIRGLRQSHTPEQLVRAVVEGVTFGVDYAMEAIKRAGVEPRRVSLVGGGANSDAWAQLCADVLGLPVARPTVTEAAASGAALQARWAVDGAAPPTFHPADATWEPRSSAALEDARQRNGELRHLAVKDGFAG
jgi:D-xylulose kinase